MKNLNHPTGIRT